MEKINYTSYVASKGKMSYQTNYLPKIKSGKQSDKNYGFNLIIEKVEMNEKNKK